MNKLLAVLVSVGLLLRSTAATPPQFTTIYQFGANNNIPGSELTIGPAGQLFGTTYGGAYSDGAGSVYELTPSGNSAYSFKELYRFDSIYSPPSDGQNPYAGLLLSSDGKTLYGTTQNGGSNGNGIQFSLDIGKAEGNALLQPKFGPGNSYNVTHVYTTDEGNGPRCTGSGVEEFVTGALFLFGTVLDGGHSGDYGALTVLEIIPSQADSIIVVVPFSPNMGTHPQGKIAIGGSSPFAWVVPHAQPHAAGFSLTNYTLYGVTSSGGSNNYGTVYSVRADGSNFVALHHFAFATTNGSSPQGGLVLSGDTLYGTTSSGGSNFSGTVFQINTNGSGFKILVNFNYSTSGNSPTGRFDSFWRHTLRNHLHRRQQSHQRWRHGYSVKTNGNNFTILHSFNSPMDDGAGHYTNRRRRLVSRGIVHLQKYSLWHHALWRLEWRGHGVSNYSAGAAVAERRARRQRRLCILALLRRQLPCCNRIQR